jgi:hypothetical protein
MVQRKTIKVGLVPTLAVDVLLGGDFGDIFPENRKLENTFNEYETLTSTVQNETLIVPENKETKFIVRAFPRKVREILVEYEKPNVGVQFPFDDEIFVSLVRVKRTKREKKYAERNYNKEMESKMVDTGVQFRFHDDLFNATTKENKTNREKRDIKRSYHEVMQSKMVDTGVQIRFNDELLFCVNDKIEKSRNEKRNVQKGQNFEIQPAVAKNKKKCWMGCALIP